MFEGKRAGVASFDTPKAVGEYVGRVARVDGRTFTLDRTAELAAGDGLCFIADGALTGTNINSVEGRRVTPNRMEGITRGAEVYRNFDQRFRLALDRSRTRRVIPATATIVFDPEGVALRYADCDGYVGEARLDEQLDLASNLERMEQTLREQAVRSGDTIFRVDRVQIEGEVRFVPLSKLGALRREALERLTELRSTLRPEHNYATEDRSAQMPVTQLDGHWNVVNRLSEQFYRDHGVERVERGLDARADLHGERVLFSSYCLRRELGECLREGSKLREPLYIEHGAFRYRLEFDCKRCQMNLIYEE
jgi:putative protease